jgi:hypothetical protein
MNWKGSSHGLIKVLSQHLSGGTEKLQNMNLKLCQYANTVRQEKRKKNIQNVAWRFPY